MHPLQVCAFRVEPGEDLTESLAKFITKAGLKAAFIVTCVGSVRSVHLRYATGKDGKEKDELIAENMEICSLVGTCSPDGAHLHATLGKADGATISGHVMGAMVVQTTAEIVLGEAVGAKFSRVFDARTGFNELLVSKLE